MNYLLQSNPLLFRDFSEASVHAADLYFQSVLLGDRSVPSSDYVNGVDYTSFPSDLVDMTMR